MKQGRTTTLRTASRGAPATVTWASRPRSTTAVTISRGMGVSTSCVALCARRSSLRSRTAQRLLCVTCLQQVDALPTDGRAGRLRMAAGCRRARRDSFSPPQGTNVRSERRTQPPSDVRHVVNTPSELAVAYALYGYVAHLGPLILLLFGRAVARCCRCCRCLSLAAVPACRSLLYLYLLYLLYLLLYLLQSQRRESFFRSDVTVDDVTDQTAEYFCHRSFHPALTRVSRSDEVVCDENRRSLLRPRAGVRRQRCS